MAISVDSHEESAELAEELEIPFSLLRDVELRTALAYGVAMEGRDIAIPAIFVVAKGGAIRWRAIGESVIDRPSAEAVLAQVAAAAA